MGPIASDELTNSLSVQKILATCPVLSVMSQVDLSLRIACLRILCVTQDTAEGLVCYDIVYTMLTITLGSAEKEC